MGIDLFNEGDQDINMALNSMVDTTSPSIGTLSETEEISFGKEPMVEEPRTMDYETELFELKQDFYDDIMSYISQVQDTGQVEKYLKGIRVAYGEQLKKLKRKYNVTDYMGEEELLTPDFLTEIQQVLSNEDALPGLQVGGLVIETDQDLKDLGIGLSLAQWNLLDEETQQRFVQSALVTKATGGAQTTTDFDMTRLDAALARARKNAEAIGTSAGARKTAVQALQDKRLSPAQIRAIGTAAGGAAATKQGGFRGFVTQYNAAKGAEAAARDLVYQDMIKNYPESQTAAESAAMADILQKEITREQSLVTSGLRGGATDRPEMTADMKNFILKGAKLPIDAKTVFNAAAKFALEDYQGDPNVAVAYLMDFGLSGDVIKSFPQYSGERHYAGKAMDFQTYYNTKKQEIAADPNVTDKYDMYSALSTAIGEWVSLFKP